MMAGRERRDLRCQMHRRRRRWARNSGEKALVFSPARLSRNRRRKGREHEVGSGAGQAAAESGRPEPRGGWGCWPGGRGPVPSSSSSSSFPLPPPACARRASWGTPGPRASARRAAVDRALPARCGVEWRRASDRIRLGRPGARRGGAESVGRDASADRIRSVPRADGASAETAGRDGTGGELERKRVRGAEWEITGEIRISVAAAFVGGGGQYRGRGVGWGKVSGGVEPSACGRRARGALVFHGSQPAGRARQAAGGRPRFSSGW